MTYYACLDPGSKASKTVMSQTEESVGRFLDGDSGIVPEVVSAMLSQTGNGRQLRCGLLRRAAMEEKMKCDCWESSAWYTAAKHGRTATGCASVRDWGWMGVGSSSPTAPHIGVTC